MLNIFVHSFRGMLECKEARSKYSPKSLYKKSDLLAVFFLRWAKKNLFPISAGRVHSRDIRILQIYLHLHTSQWFYSHCRNYTRA